MANTQSSAHLRDIERVSARREKNVATAAVDT